MADQFDYFRQQQDIAYRQALAKQMAANAVPQQRGQMIGDRYVSASPLDALNVQLGRFGSMYQDRKARDEQGALDKQDRAAYAEGMKKLLGSQDPESFRADAEVASPMPQAGYTYKDPNAVGPTMDQLQGVKAMPVASSPMPMPNPAAPQMAAPQRMPMPQQVAPQPVMPPQGPVQPTPQQIEQRAQPTNEQIAAATNRSVLANIRSNMRPQDVVPPNTPRQAPASNGGASGSWDAAPAAPAAPAGPAAQPAAAPVRALPQAAALQAAQAPASAPAMPEPVQSAAIAPTAPAAADPIAQDFNVSQPTQEDRIAAAEGQARFLKKASAAQKQAAYEQLAGTKDGRVLVQALQTRELENALSDKNGRYKTDVHADPVNGGFIKVTTDSRTGQTSISPVASGSGAGKGKFTIETGEDGTKYKVYASGAEPEPVSVGGTPIREGSVVDKNTKQAADQSDKKAKMQADIGTQEALLSQLTEGKALISKVGTGRFKTPINKLGAYFKDSTDYDTMNRIFNADQLQSAVTWLKGQGSVTEGERALLAKGGFNPDSSTEANLDYANKVTAMMRKHLDVAKNSYQSQFGGGTGSQPQGAGPKPGHMYSWQK